MFKYRVMCCYNHERWHLLRMNPEWLQPKYAVCFVFEEEKKKHNFS